MDENESGISILEAVETLASIADLSEDESQKLRNALLLEGKRLGERKVDWLRPSRGGNRIVLLKKSLETVHQYFKSLWREKDPTNLPRDVRDGIKTIWILVGQALDKASKTEEIFRREAGVAPRELPEYQELYSFYTRKIDPKIDEGRLGRWVLGLGQLPFPMAKPSESLLKKKISLSPQHLIVDLESLKTDQDYELLFIRRSDGSRFYNPRLLRNLKLISEVGFEKTDEVLPIYSPWRWVDRQCESAAKLILDQANRLVEPFLKERGKFKERDLSRNLTYGLVALMLATHPRYLSDNDPAKSTSAFFKDLLSFLTDSLVSTDFRRMIGTPDEDANKLSRLLKNLPQVLSYALFTEVPSFSYEGFVRFIQGGNEGRVDSLSESLKTGFRWIEEGMKGFSNTPLKRDLDDLEEQVPYFDPLQWPILPAKFGELRLDDKVVTLHKMAAPIRQEVIDHASLNPLFVAALLEMKARQEKVLIFNLQERSHWKERARSELLEKLSEKEMWRDTVQVVTLDTASEFFLQEMQFDKGDTTESFIESYRQYLLDDRGENYFPPNVEEALFPGFIEKAFQEVQKHYFNSRNVLSPDLKRRFIDVMSHLIQIKLIDTLKPDRVIFIDKDGNDTASIASTLFFMTPKLFHHSAWTEKDVEIYEAILHSSTLLYRERPIRKFKFQRMTDYLSWLEEINKTPGFWTKSTPAISSLFSNGTDKASFIPFFS